MGGKSWVGFLAGAVVAVGSLVAWGRSRTTE